VLQPVAQQLQPSVALQAGAESNGLASYGSPVKQELMPSFMQVREDPKPFSTGLDVALCVPYSGWS
jgi:hypothetical protein